MNLRKLNISPWLLVGFVTLLLLGCLISAVGTSFARYRTGAEGDLIIRPEQNAQVYLGGVQEDAFVHQQSAWVATEEQLQLSFAISNGTSDKNFATVDQQVRVCLVTSLGAWSAEQTASIYLVVNEVTYAATAQRITEGSALHAQFGDGWVFCFQDEAGKEPAWQLPGNQWNCTQMLLQIDAAAIADTSLLQLQVIPEVI